MADDVSFTISASDQASKAVETVQKKIQNFGSDVAKLALGVVGPMALLQAGIGYVTEKWQEYKQAQTDAFENGAKGTYDQLKAQTDLGMQLDKNLSILLAMAKIETERAKNAEDIKAQEDQAIKAFLKTEEGVKFQQKHTVQSTDESYYLATRQQELEAARELGRIENERIQAENDQLNDPSYSEKELKNFREMLEINKELEKRGGKSLFDISALDRFTKAFKEDSLLPKQKTKDAVKDDLKLTVSSLREIGGSFGGGDVNTGIERQITIQQDQLDTLKEIKDALNKGSLESQVFPESLVTAMKETA
jgi:hypothetical protein